MTDSIEHIISQGKIDGDFEGFDENKKFKLTNGEVWQQVRFKYLYHYAYMPKVKVVQTNNGFELIVEGLDESVMVRKLK